MSGCQRQRGSHRQRGVAGHAALARLAPAAILLLALACSGPIDIVGVVDDAESEAGGEPASSATGAAPPTQPGAARVGDAASDASDVALLLVGQPVTDWRGQAREWPLSVPLGELFAGAPLGDRDGRDRVAPLPWSSRRLASSVARGSARGSSGVGVRSPRLDARLLILAEDEARLLLALMTPAASADTERGAVFRDALGDVYRVSLESDELALDGIGCGGRTRREAFECGGRGPSD